LILLDLNLPRIDGRQILHRVKSNPKLRGIPVLILSSSSNPKDIAECYELQANCYLIKPMEVDSFFELIQKVEDLWFLQKGMPNSPVSDHGCYGHSLVASSRSIAANA
jgi:CheY-like chemotaxis protein